MTLPNYPAIHLKKGREDAVYRLHPWIFSGAIYKMEQEELPLGSLVHIFSADNTLLGCGFYEGGSIAVRMLSFGESIENFELFIQEKIKDAFYLRHSLELTPSSTEQETPYNNVYRLIHGEGDGLSGLIVDVYGETAVVQAHCIGMFKYIEVIAQNIIDLSRGTITAVFDKSSSSLANVPIDSIGDRFLIGKNETIPVFENGIQFYPDWLHGQKTGFFIDQRDNRAIVKKYAKDRRVLNMFCYSGGFSLYALQGGASEVVSVDSSARALSLVDKNIALNFDDAIAGGRHESVVADAFDYLKRSAKDAFDLIILDPPAFAKKRSAIKNALNGYRKLNALALERIEKGGLLFTYSCSQAISADDFRLAVLTAAIQAKRNVRILSKMEQSKDHPISIFHPEGEYLKGLLLYVE